MPYRIRANVRDPRFQEIVYAELEVESDDIANMDNMIERAYKLLSGLATPQG